MSSHTANALQACSRPEVLSAVLECTQDSSKTAEYEHDPDVKMVCAYASPVQAACIGARAGSCLAQTHALLLTWTFGVLQRF